MTEIEECRGNEILQFRSWKAQAKFLIIEVQQLQQLIDNERCKLAFEGAMKKARRKGIRFTTIEERWIPKKKKDHFEG